MDITRRQVVLAMLLIQLVLIALIALGQAALDPSGLALPAAVVGTVVTGVVLAAYLRGWEIALVIDVLVITALVGIALPEPFVTRSTALLVLAPPALALILVGPGWIIGSMLALLVILSLRAGASNGFWTAYIGDVRTVSTLLFVVGSMFLSRLVADTAARRVAAEARRAAEALARAEQQAGTLAEQAAELAAQNAQQRRLIDLVATLETPAVALADGVLLVPLLGSLDSQRLGMLTQRLLHDVSTQRARMAVLDIAGVAEVNEEIARGLLRAAQAVRLLGCEVAITGIAPAVASTLAQSGVSLAGVMTARAPQEVLARIASTDAA